MEILTSEKRLLIQFYNVKQPTYSKIVLAHQITA